MYFGVFGVYQEQLEAFREVEGAVRLVKHENDELMAEREVG